MATHAIPDSSSIRRSKQVAKNIFAYVVPASARQKLVSCTENISSYPCIQDSFTRNNTAKPSVPERCVSGENAMWRSQTCVAQVFQHQLLLFTTLPRSTSDHQVTRRTVHSYCDFPQGRIPICGYTQLTSSTRESIPSKWDHTIMRSHQ